MVNFFSHFWGVKDFGEDFFGGTDSKKRAPISLFMQIKKRYFLGTKVWAIGLSWGLGLAYKAVTRLFWV